MNFKHIMGKLGAAVDLNLETSPQCKLLTPRVIAARNQQPQNHWRVPFLWFEKFFHDSHRQLDLHRSANLLVTHIAILNLAFADARSYFSTRARSGIFKYGISSTGYSKPLAHRWPNFLLHMILSWAIARNLLTVEPPMHTRMPAHRRVKRRGRKSRILDQSTKEPQALDL